MENTQERLNLFHTVIQSSDKESQPHFNSFDSIFILYERLIYLLTYLLIHKVLVKSYILNINNIIDLKPFGLIHFSHKRFFIPFS